VTIYGKKITTEQREWLKQYESDTGFEPMYQKDIDSGEKTFYEAARANVQWYESHTSKYIKAFSGTFLGKTKRWRGSDTSTR
jgi:hypothetical protein